MLLVMGSVNHDLTAYVHEFVRPGETILASGSSTATGGKSANQAAAAALSSVETTLVARCGTDSQGDEAVAALADRGVDVSSMIRSDTPTGTALIHLRSDSENTITVIPGANAELSSQDCTDELLAQADWLLLCLEVPVPTVLEIARRARALGVKVALNLSPSTPEELSLEDIDLAIVNDGEAYGLAGGAPLALNDPAGTLGLGTLVVTHGAKGASVFSAGTSEAVMVASLKVDAVDTTGCGDAFAGTLIGRLAEGDPIARATAWASQFAAQAATAPGALSSYPRHFQFDA